MTLFRRIARRLGHLFRRGQSEAEMAEEMRFHLEQRAADYAADGLPAEEAQFAAQRKFGNAASIQEQAREVNGFLWLENLMRDVRLGIRSLRKSPGFTLVAIVTIALGVGANTAMFSTFNDIILRPLSYPHSDELDRFFRAPATDRNQLGGFSPADYLELQSKMQGYGEIAAYAVGGMSLSEPGRPAEMVSGSRVSANFFSVFGLQPQLGRDFRPEEVLRGNHRVLIINDRCWQNRFGRDPRIIGRIVRVDGEPHEIIGVMPASFHDWRNSVSMADFFRPFGFTAQESTDRSSTGLRLVGHRSPGLSRAAADSFITGFGARLAADFPAANAGSTWRVMPLNEVVRAPRTKISMMMLIGLSGFVLLIACSNLANLLLVRTMVRAREFAVRAALGASRFQLLLPLLIESLLLALAGGICAIFVANWVTDWLSVRSTSDEGNFVPFHTDWTVLGWALLASLATALAFGLAPALFAMRIDVNATLKSGARGATGGRGQQRLRHLLIVGQFALAMVLLAGAAIFGRGLHEANYRRYGWESEYLVSGSILLPAATYSGAEEITAFHRLVVERLEALPGVKSASLSTTMPFFGLGGPRRYLVQGRAAPEPGHEPAAAFNGVSPRYFETVGTRLLAGRVFNDGDNLASPRVYIINQAMAASLFGSENPLGRRLAQAGGTKLEWGEIVGVVDDVQSVVPEAKAVTWQLYQSLAQEPPLASEIAVRTSAVAPSIVVDRIRTTMAKLNADLPVRNLRPADATVVRANYQQAVLADMLFALASLGLGLATLGIYGVIARTVAQRAPEFGIRLALGAKAADLTRLVLRSGVKLALIGSAIGLLGAVGLARLIAAGFPNLTTGSSAPVLAGVTLLLTGVALAACWLPARRASKVDPMLALHAE